MGGDDAAFSSLEPASSRKAMQRKIVSETAFFLYCVHPVHQLDAALAQQFRDLRKTLGPLARNRQALMDLCLDPANAYLHVGAHIVLRSLGSPDALFDGFLEDAALLSAGLGDEQKPSEELEQAWLARLWLGAPDRRIPPTSALSRRLDVLAGSRGGLYALTHTIMFTTGFGQWRLPRTVRRRDLLLDAEAALAFTLERRDHDLMAELLMAWPHLRAPWTASAAFCFQLLARVQGELGFLPGPEFEAGGGHASAGQAARRHVHETSYHTTYVMGMLCACCLSTGRLPPPEVPAARAPAGIGKAAQALFEQSGFRPEWLTATDSLRPPQLDSLAPLLLTALARHAKGQLDAALMRAILELAHHHSYVSPPAVHQTVSLLRRLRTLAAAP